MIDSKTPNAVGYSAGILLKAMEYRSLADDIAELKRLAGEREE